MNLFKTLEIYLDPLTSFSVRLDGDEDNAHVCLKKVWCKHQELYRQSRCTLSKRKPNLICTCVQRSWEKWDNLIFIHFDA